MKQQIMYILIGLNMCLLYVYINSRRRILRQEKYEPKCNGEYSVCIS